MSSYPKGSDLITIRQFKDASGVGDSAYDSNDVDELLPVHKDVLRVRALLNSWSSEQLAPMFFFKNVLFTARTMTMLAIMILFLFLAPFPFFVKRTRYIVIAVTALVYPIVIYLHHRLCLEKSMLKALSVNDLRNIAFNYITGAFFIAELLIPKKAATSIRNSGKHIDYDRVMIGFGCYRMFMDKTSDDEISNIGGDRTTGNKHIAQVRHLYIRPDYRRRGIGSTLVRYIYEHASRQRYLGLVAAADGYLSAATAFLEDNGFRLLDKEAPEELWERLLLPRGESIVYDRPVLAPYAQGRAQTRRKDANGRVRRRAGRQEEEEDDDEDIDFAVDTGKPGLVRRKPGQAQNKLRPLDASSLGRDPEADIRNMHEYLDAGNAGLGRGPGRMAGSAAYPVRVGASGLVGEDGGVYRGESVTVAGTPFGGQGGRARPGKPLTQEEVIGLAMAGKTGGSGTGRYAISSSEAQDLTDEQLKSFLESLKRE